MLAAGVAHIGRAAVWLDRQQLLEILRIAIAAVA